MKTIDEYLDLYPHQSEALKKLRTGSILCGGVGSGKSRTALAYFSKECKVAIEDGIRFSNPKDLYIITTAQKRDKLEWDAEFSKLVLVKNDRENSLENILVTVDSWNNIKKYVDVKDAFFIFDEQRVVGYGTWAKSFLKIAKSNEWILLTATPGDVWTDYIPVFIANGFYKNKTEFIRRHAVFDMYAKYPKIRKFMEVGHLIKLRDSILVNMPYVKPANKHLIETIVDYDEDLMEIVSKNRWNVFYSKPIDNISELCSLERRIVNSYLERLSEIKKIVDSKKKVIIFYNFDYELSILKTLSKYYPLAEWNGHKHELIPETDSWIYLVQYMAGCEGWNCVQTDTMIFYSLNYSYRIMLQATGRIDRLNTPYKDLYYYVFKTNSQIDKAISKALKNKETFNESSFSSYFLERPS